MTETNILKELSRIQKELKAPKNQFNKFGNYNYRSCEDILEAVKPLLGECALTTSDKIIEIGQRIYVESTARLSLSKDDFFENSASAREPENKKGMDEAQITGATSSYARKYALNGLFCIDDNKDADATNKHGKEDTSAANNLHDDETYDQYVSTCEQEIRAARNPQELTNLFKSENFKKIADYLEKNSKDHFSRVQEFFNTKMQSLKKVA